MGIRRALALTSAAVTLLASGWAGASEAYRMDGTRTTVRQYRATLTDTAVPMQSLTRAQVTPPLIADCTPGSCDIRELRLVLPKGTTVGRFGAGVVVPRTLVGSLAVYDAAGKLVDYDDAAFFGGFRYCCEVGTYTLRVDVERLRAGRYTVAIINRAGSGELQAKVEWRAHPPDRRR